ncbi:uncharacterized protein GJ701_013635 isoform 3-T3 [Geothlypis trichas]
MLSVPVPVAGAGAARGAGSLPRRRTMCSGVGCFWALLSAGLLAACAAAFLSPAWLLPPGRAAAGFGLLWRCAGPPRGCHGSAGPGGFGDIPSGSWQTSAVLCAGGCALLALSSLLAIVAVLLPGGACERRLCTLAGYMQTAAGMCSCSSSRLCLSGTRKPELTHRDVANSISLAKRSGMETAFFCHGI